MRDFLKIAVTGGVACGKTAVCSRLLSRFPEGRAAFVSCDELVRELLVTEVVKDGIAAIGAVYEAELLQEGEIDRKELRELLFENSEFRGKVEKVLHPLVLQRVIAQMATLTDPVRVAIIEVPLLYEVDFPLERDVDLVVAASESTQMRRLCLDRGLDAIIGRRIIGAQVPIDEKIRRGNIVVWNDGDRSSLESQTDNLMLRCARLFN